MTKNNKTRICKFCDKDRPILDFCYKKPIVLNCCKYCKNNVLVSREISNSIKLKFSICALVKSKISVSRKHASKHGYASCNATVYELQPLFTTKCDICNTECGRSIHLDHCHETGKFRGFICSRCNLIIGQAKDSPEYMEQIASWLRGKQALG